MTPSKWTNPYKFSAYRSSAATSGNGSFAQVVFNTELFDTNGNFASGAYTVPVNGFYQFNWKVSSSATASIWISALFKNGSSIAVGEEKRTSLTPNVSSGSILLQLSAGDVIDVRVQGNSAIALDTQETRNNFSGFLVSED